MIYPYKDKFVCLESIRESLTGYGRFIFYQAFGKDNAISPSGGGGCDPTLLAHRRNWLMEVREGAFRFGKAEGY